MSALVLVLLLVQVLGLALVPALAVVLVLVLALVLALLQRIPSDLLWSVLQRHIVLLLALVATTSTNQY